MRLKEQAESCKFGDNEEVRILEQLIQTIEVKDSEMITKEIQKQWNLNKFFEEACQQYDLKRQVKEITKTDTNTINSEDRTIKRK